MCWRGAACAIPAQVNRPLNATAVFENLHRGVPRKAVRKRREKVRQGDRETETESESESESESARD